VLGLGEAGRCPWLRGEHQGRPPVKAQHQV
jgi:hypothetical protein